MNSKKTKVYICSNLSVENVNAVNQILNKIDLANFILFRPTSAQLVDKETSENLKRLVVLQDVAWINEADEIWVLGKFGEDCNWELGYATAKGKKIVIFADDSNQGRIKDYWMFRFAEYIQQLQFIDLKVNGQLQEEMQLSGEVK